MRDFYLSGPMTGYKNHNFALFNKVAAGLRAEGYTVFNPAETDGGLASGSREYYMEIDYAAVLHCNCVMLLPGWKESRGALRELVEAHDIGRTVYTLELLSEKGIDGDCGKDWSWQRLPAEYIEEHLVVRWEDKEAKQEEPLTARTSHPIPTTEPLHPVVTIQIPAWEEVVREVEQRREADAKKPERESVLMRAHSLVHGSRGKLYGHPIDDLDRTGWLWTGILRDLLRPGRIILAERVCLMMDALKISRECNAIIAGIQSESRDNRVDGPGYWECEDMVVEERARRKAAIVDTLTEEEKEGICQSRKS